MKPSLNTSLTGLFGAAGVAVLAILCWRFGFADLAATFSRVTPAYLLGYLAFGCAALMGYSLRWCLVARTLGGSPPFARLAAARLAGDAVGGLLPTGRISGDPVRIALVYGDGLGGAQATAGVAIDRLIEMMGNTMCAVTYVALFSFAHASGGSPRVAVSLLVTLCILLLALAVPLGMLRRGMRPLQPLYRLAVRSDPATLPAWAGALQRTESYLMEFFRDHAWASVSALLGSLIIEVLVVIEYHCLFVAFGIALDLPTLLMTLVASGMARVVPAPAGVGALEAGEVAVLAAASGRPEIGFVVGIVMRLHETLWAAAGFAVLVSQGFSLARLRLMAAEAKLTA